MESLLVGFILPGFMLVVLWVLTLFLRWEKRNPKVKEGTFALVFDQKTGEHQGTYRQGRYKFDPKSQVRWVMYAVDHLSWTEPISFTAKRVVGGLTLKVNGWFIILCTEGLISFIEEHGIGWRKKVDDLLKEAFEQALKDPSQMYQALDDKWLMTSNPATLALAELIRRDAEGRQFLQNLCARAVETFSAETGEKYGLQISRLTVVGGRAYKVNYDAARQPIRQ